MIIFKIRCVTIIIKNNVDEHNTKMIQIESTVGVTIQTMLSSFKEALYFREDAL